MFRNAASAAAWTWSASLCRGASIFFLWTPFRPPPLPFFCPLLASYVYFVFLPPLCSSSTHRWHAHAKK